jgi:hypothetical protein
MAEHEDTLVVELDVLLRLHRQSSQALELAIAENP